MTHGLLHVCVHVYMAYMCEGVGERVCWFDEAIGGMLVEMNLGSRGGGGAVSKRPGKRNVGPCDVIVSRNVSAQAHQPQSPWPQTGCGVVSEA